MKKESKYALEQIVNAFLDVTDGMDGVADYIYKTGMPRERCEEVAAIRADVFEQFGKQWLSSKSQGDIP